MNNNVNELINNVEEGRDNMNNEELNEIEEEIEEVECYNCGAMVSIDDTREVEGEHVCQECIDNHYYTCDDCGELVHEDNVCWTTDDIPICSDCADRYYNYCEDCERYDRDTTYIENYGNVCNNCYGRGDYHYCERCDNYFRGDDMTFCDEDEQYYCDECYDERCEELEEEENNDYVGYYHEHHSQYGRHIQYVEGEDEENTFTYGVETETESVNGNRDNEREYIEVLNGAPIKNEREHDSSLDYSGVEVITYPFSYEYAMANVEGMKETFEKAIALGYRGDRSNCGIHIHVKRPSDEVIDRIWLIMETFKREIIEVARRHNEHYAHFISDYNGNVGENTLKSLYYIEKNKNKSDRYYALNLTNEKTIEFRIFKSTLNYRTWYAYLQFINNIMVECSNLEKPVEDITWEDLTRGEFISELVTNRNIVCYTRVVDNTKRIQDEKAKRDEIIDKMDKIFKKYSRQLLSILSIDKSKFENVGDLLNRLVDFREEKLYYVINILSNMRNLIEYKNSEIELPVLIDKINRFMRDNSSCYVTELQMSDDIKNAINEAIGSNMERGEE